MGAVDDIPMDLHDAAIWDAHMEVFTTAVPERVDAVFTSESYGGELARRFGAESVLVDPGRTLFPVSGTAVRADPAGCWDYLEPPCGPLSPAAWSSWAPSRPAPRPWPGR